MENLREKGELKKCIKSAIASKQYGLEDFLSEKISEACLYAMPNDAKKFKLMREAPSRFFPSLNSEAIWPRSRSLPLGSLDQTLHGQRGKSSETRV